MEQKTMLSDERLAVIDELGTRYPHVLTIEWAQEVTGYVLDLVKEIERLSQRCTVCQWYRKASWDRATDAYCFISAKDLPEDGLCDRNRFKKREVKA